MLHPFFWSETENTAPPYRGHRESSPATRLSAPKRRTFEFSAPKHLGGWPFTKCWRPADFANISWDDFGDHGWWIAQKLLTVPKESRLSLEQMKWFFQCSWPCTDVSLWAAHVWQSAPRLRLFCSKQWNNSGRHLASGTPKRSQVPKRTILGEKACWVLKFQTFQTYSHWSSFRIRCIRCRWKHLELYREVHLGLSGFPLADGIHLKMISESRQVQVQVMTCSRTRLGDFWGDRQGAENKISSLPEPVGWS